MLGKDIHKVLSAIDLLHAQVSITNFLLQEKKFHMQVSHLTGAFFWQLGAKLSRALLNPPVKQNCFP